jgi:glycine cleavage system H protein
MAIPDRLRYSTDHEWVSVEGGRARMGITDYAQDALGDVVFVDVPALGRSVTAGDSMSEVESTKSVSDIYAPVSGTIVAVNELLSSQPDALNRDPYGDGWICEIEMSDPTEVEGLLDSVGYRSLVES